MSHYTGARPFRVDNATFYQVRSLRRDLSNRETGEPCNWSRFGRRERTPLQIEAEKVTATQQLETPILVPPGREPPSRIVYPDGATVWMCSLCGGCYPTEEQAATIKGDPGRKYKRFHLCRAQIRRRKDDR